MGVEEEAGHCNLIYLNGKSSLVWSKEDRRKNNLRPSSLYMASNYRWIV